MTLITADCSASLNNDFISFILNQNIEEYLR